MIDRSRYVITRGYGKCIEAMIRIDDELSWLSTQKNPTRTAELLEDRAAWLELANVTPRFVHELPAVAHG